jgi:multidrug efflux pump subunit AcrB
VVTQILNFGRPSQIDIRTKELKQRIAAISGIADAHLQ